MTEEQPEYSAMRWCDNSVDPVESLPITTRKALRFVLLKGKQVQIFQGEWSLAYVQILEEDSIEVSIDNCSGDVRLTRTQAYELSEALRAAVDIVGDVGDVSSNISGISGMEIIEYVSEEKSRLGSPGKIAQSSMVPDFLDIVTPDRYSEIDRESVTLIPFITRPGDDCTDWNGWQVKIGNDMWIIVPTVGESLARVCIGASEENESFRVGDSAVAILRYLDIK